MGRFVNIPLCFSRTIILGRAFTLDFKLRSGKGWGGYEGVGWGARLISRSGAAGQRTAQGASRRKF